MQIEGSSPNSISIAWQFPQVFVLTVGEILLSITGNEFAYSQAPASMKSVGQIFIEYFIFCICL
jgi:dipeptide/tripeptide permease